MQGGQAVDHVLEGVTAAPMADPDQTRAEFEDSPLHVAVGNISSELRRAAEDPRVHTVVLARTDEQRAGVHALGQVCSYEGELPLLRLHGDCHGGNVLWTPDGPHFVDFDDSRMGPAVQDLWMLLSGDRASMQSQLASLLAGYEDFCEFDTRELYLVEALRTLRLLHYSAWLARRWNDPAFPAAFPWFNTQRYWQDRVLELREQIALLDEPPLW